MSLVLSADAPGALGEGPEYRGPIGFPGRRWSRAYIRGTGVWQRVQFADHGAFVRPHFGHFHERCGVTGPVATPSGAAADRGSTTGEPLADDGGTGAAAAAERAGTEEGRLGGTHAAEAAETVGRAAG
ncbi:MAG: hypothetical protein WBG19_05590 [Thermoplasmata archaeon]